MGSPAQLLMKEEKKKKLGPVFFLPPAKWFKFSKFQLLASIVLSYLWKQQRCLSSELSLESYLNRSKVASPWGCPSFPSSLGSAHCSSAIRVCGGLRRCHPTLRKHLGRERKKRGVEAQHKPDLGPWGSGGAQEGPGGDSPSGPRVGWDSQSQSLAFTAGHFSP